MGNVVKLETQTRRRRRRSKTALVLGGGGFTGAVYEIGALRALDLLSVNRTVNDFDVYVGTSAGALVAALTSNGVTPETMMRVVNDQVVPGFPAIQREMLLRPNYREFLVKGLKLPFHLGAEGWDDVPISSAVRASTALPMVYEPYQVKDRELVDGGIVSTTNLDIAVEAGAKFIVVVNPLVPFVNDFTKEIPTLFGTRTRRVSDMGFPKIGYQTFKLLAYQRLHEMAESWKERYPGVDIVLIEPEPDDELMFQTNILNYNSRIAVARHGFATVTQKLAASYDEWRDVASRHGIQISATRVRKVVEHYGAEKEKTRAWRRILEQTTGTLLRQSAGEQ